MIKHFVGNTIDSIVYNELLLYKISVAITTYSHYRIDLQKIIEVEFNDIQINYYDRIYFTILNYFI